MLPEKKTRDAKQAMIHVRTSALWRVQLMTCWAAVLSHSLGSRMMMDFAVLKLCKHSKTRKMKRMMELGSEFLIIPMSTTQGFRSGGKKSKQLRENPSFEQSRVVLFIDMSAGTTQLHDTNTHYQIKYTSVDLPIILFQLLPPPPSPPLTPECDGCVC
jgi:hypothetical protein